MPAEASPLKVTIQDSVIVAMRAKEKERLATLRQITAAIKQIEIDKRIDLADDDIITVLTKMCKQRRDSLSQFQDAGRDDLAAIEIAELAIIGEFMPTALSDEEVAAEIKAAIAESGA
ncbi:glutamyl-tRNA amidotransferase, partial [Methylophaga sp. 42_8_T64]